MKDHVIASIRVYLVLTLLLGFAYPFAVWGLGRIAFRDKANGSLLRMKESGAGASSDRIVGSSLLGQSFHSKNLFHSRPSAAGDAGYDPTASGGTNLGPTSKKLADSVATAVASARGVNPGATGGVQGDAVPSTAAGLDQHISPENALWQIPRVAKESGIPEADLRALVERRTERRFLGVFGEPRVNVLLLNRDLLERLGQPATVSVSR